MVPLDAGDVRKNKLGNPAHRLAGPWRGDTPLLNHAPAKLRSGHGRYLLQDAHGLGPARKLHYSDERVERHRARPARV